jgi:hypothetical protein
MTNMLDALRERLDLCQKWKILVNRLISTDQQTLTGKLYIDNSARKHRNSQLITFVVADRFR